MDKVVFLTNVDHGAAGVMKKLLFDNSYDILVKPTADEWLDETGSDGFVLALISQELPLDYLETCRLVRNDSSVPVIILSDRSDTVDKVIALEMGADDYLAIPYERLELVARIRSLLRRSSVTDGNSHSNRKKSATDLIVIGPLKIDCNFRDAFVEEQPVGLTNLEFKLLHHFITHQGKLLSKEEIFTTIWGYDISTNSHSLGAYIHMLKKKLRSHGIWLPLQCFNSYGYKMSEVTVVNLFTPADKSDVA